MKFVINSDVIEADPKTEKNAVVNIISSTLMDGCMELNYLSKVVCGC